MNANEGRRRPTGRLVMSLLCCAVAGLLAAVLPAARADIQVDNVAAGEATFHQEGSHTTIEAVDRTIINYERFGIPHDSSVQFVQPDASSRVLNRILGGNPSAIDGALLANGIVYFVNPAGVFFGPDSVVEVGGLIAAAGQISDADFLAGIDRFTGLEGPVENRGIIRAEDGARLMGRNVLNTGTIVARRGLVSLLSGEEAYLAEQGSDVMVRVDTMDASTATGEGPGGEASAEFGVRNEGLVEGDEVVFAAGDVYSLALLNSGRVQARDAVTMSGDGYVVNTAEVEAPGGTVRLLGETVVHAGSIDTSAPDGGGRVLIGGGLEGEGPERNAAATFLTSSSRVAADALEEGDGGDVIVWSDLSTRSYGEISVRGGAEGGDGGFVETSGRRHLDVRGAPDLRAPAGRGGTWLLDPSNIRIVQEGETSGIDEVLPTPTFDLIEQLALEEMVLLLELPPDEEAELRNFSPDFLAESFAEGAVVVITDLMDALQGDETTVMLKTGSEGEEHGDIIFEADLDYNNLGRNFLVLWAHRHIIMEGDIYDSDPGTSEHADGVDWLGLDLGSGQERQPGGDIVVLGSIDTSGGEFRALTSMTDQPAGSFILDPDASINTRGGEFFVLVNHEAQISGSVDAGGGEVIVIARAGDVMVDATGSVTTSDEVIDLVAGRDVLIDGTVSGTGTCDLGLVARERIVLGSGAVVRTENGWMWLGDEELLFEGDTPVIHLFDADVGTDAGNIDVFYPLLLRADAVLTAGDDLRGNVTFHDTVDSSADGHRALTVQGYEVAFEEAVGAEMALQGLTVDAEGFVTVGNSLAVVEDITLTAANVAFEGGPDSVSGAGRLLVQPADPEYQIAIGDPWSWMNELQLTHDDIAALADGFADITVGRADGRHDITVGYEVTFRDPVTIRTPEGGQIAVYGHLVGADDASITLIGPGSEGIPGTTHLEGSIRTEGNPILIDDDVVIGWWSTILDTTKEGQFDGADIEITGSVNADPDFPDGWFSIYAGPDGDVLVRGPVGDETPLHSLRVGGQAWWDDYEERGARSVTFLDDIRVLSWLEVEALADITLEGDVDTTLGHEDYPWGDIWLWSMFGDVSVHGLLAEDVDVEAGGSLHLQGDAIAEGPDGYGYLSLYARDDLLVDAGLTLRGGENIFLVAGMNVDGDGDIIFAGSNPTPLTELQTNMLGMLVGMPVERIVEYLEGLEEEFAGGEPPDVDSPEFLLGIIREIEDVLRDPMPTGQIVGAENAIVRGLEGGETSPTLMGLLQGPAVTADHLPALAGGVPTVFGVATLDDLVFDGDLASALNDPDRQSILVLAGHTVSLEHEVQTGHLGVIGNTITLRGSHGSWQHVDTGGSQFYVAASPIVLGGGALLLLGEFGGLNGALVPLVEDGNGWIGDIELSPEMALELIRMVQQEAPGLLDGNIVVDTTTLLQSREGSIFLVGAVDSGEGEPNALEMFVEDMAVIAGPVGQEAPPFIFRVSGGETHLLGGLVRTAEPQVLPLGMYFGQNYETDLLLHRDTEMHGTLVRFAGHVDSFDRPAGLSVYDQQRTTIAGPVGDRNPLASLRTAETGDVLLGADITAGSPGRLTVEFNNPVLLADDVTITDLGEAGIFFRSTVDSAADPVELELLTNTAIEGQQVPVVFFGDDVGGLNSLSALLVNPDGRPAVPLVATVVVQPTGGDGVSFEVGRFEMGQNEKLTSLGDLTILADEAWLGDVGVDGSLTVSTAVPDTTYFRLRDAGWVLTADGRLVQDQGLDIIARDDILFEGAVQTVGEGPAPRFTSILGQIIGLPPQFEVVEWAHMPVLVRDGIVLDAVLTEGFVDWTGIDFGFPPERPGEDEDEEVEDKFSEAEVESD